MRFLIPLLLLLPGAPQDDKAAAELLKKVRNRALEAETIQAKFKMTFEERDEKGEFTCEATVKGKTRARLVMTLAQRGRKETLILVCDGKKIRAKGDMRSFLEAPLDFSPAELVKVLRHSAGTTMVECVFLVMEFGRRKRPGLPEPTQIKWAGKEKIGDVEASVITYVLEYSPRRTKLVVKAWIDPSKHALLRNEVTVEGEVRLDETVETLKFDSELSDDLFSLQNAETLLQGRTHQVAKAVALYTKYTGRPPGRLGDLLERPEDLDKDIFWPDGGFWLGNKPPADIPYRVSGLTPVVGATELRPGTRRPIVAPTERLRKFFNARVDLALLGAAVEAFQTTYGEFPGKSAYLWERPEWARVWPEGGFAPGGIPDDPWGRPYRIVSEKDCVRVLVPDFRKRTISRHKLTEKELKGLEEGGRTRLSEKEVSRIEDLIEELGDESPEVRDRAAEDLAAWGPAIADLLKERAEKEDDAEARNRLRSILGRHGRIVPAWRGEFRPLLAVVNEEGRGVSNERFAVGSLKTLCTAQADFRSNDRDGNLVNDFWNADVQGLYAAKGADDRPLKLIEKTLACADADPKPKETDMEYIEMPAFSPRAGYVYAALKYYEDADGKPVAYDKGNGRNPSRFGFVAYPEEYGIGGRMTFIISEEFTMFKADMGGDTVDTFPFEPVNEGWTPMD